MGVGSVTVLSPELWRALETAHHRRVDAIIGPHLARRSRGDEHPVEDFLFTYYAHRPGRLRRWHPGLGVALADAAERRDWSGYLHDGSLVRADVGAFSGGGGKADLLRSTRDLLRATASRPAQLSCFGMHEWAMVYRSSGGSRPGPAVPAQAVRHPAWPLRLGAEGTDAVVESNPLRCSHFDAYRFFTPQAAPLNSMRPGADTRAALEQPGCLHAGMDVYKMAFRLSPLVPSDLLMDCFDLARAIRAVDMRASPYDLSGLGYAPIRVETPAGKAEYVAAQRQFAARGQRLRRRLLSVVEALAADIGEDVGADVGAEEIADVADQRTGTDWRSRP